MLKLSILIPCYNEEKNLEKIVKKIEDVHFSNIKKELIFIDDGSTDQTPAILKKIVENHPNYRVITHHKNQGKGTAIRTGLQELTSDFTIIQDADLEYDPHDYKKLLDPMLNHGFQVVYGSRERNKNNKTHSGLSFYLGGKFLSWLTNFLYGSNLTDEATCYKLFQTDLLKKIPLTCKRFEFCPEVTAKILKKGIPIKEVPISYHPRKKNEGKKINWKDGLEAIWTLLKYRFIN